MVLLERSVNACLSHFLGMSMSGAQLDSSECARSKVETGL